MTFILVFIAVFSSYLVGSICSAVIVCRLCHLPDPRTEGSQNPGATNVLRLSGKKYAAIVLLADLLKGLVPVVIFNMMHIGSSYLGYIGLAAVLGHIYPIFFQFKGGKGVATTLGVLFGLNGVLGLMVVATWLIVAYISRYSSLAAMVALACMPFYGLFLSTPHHFFSLFLMAILVIYQHRSNIQRLRSGTESKIK